MSLKCMEYKSYQFPVNDDVSGTLCEDKSALYEVLKGAGVPGVEHQLFPAPRMCHYFRKNGVWQDIIEYAEKYEWNVVCKPNRGTGGNKVFRAKTNLELQVSVEKIWETERDVTLSPFVTIDYEYRAIYLFGNVELVYRKEQPSVTGDGKSTIRDLFLKQMSNLDSKSMALFFNDLDTTLFSQENLDSVLEEGKRFPLKFKHNLGQGAGFKVLMEKDGDSVREAVVELATKACRAVGVNFCSVDIVHDALNDSLKVLEINRGVMFSRFVDVKEHEGTVEKIYATMIKKLFNL